MEISDLPPLRNLKAITPPEAASSDAILNCLRRAMSVAYQYDVASIKLSLKLKDGSYHNDMEPAEIVDGQ